MHGGNICRLVAATRVAIHLSGVGLVADGLEVSGGNVVDELGENGESQLGIRQRTPGIKLGTRHLRIGLGQIQAAIGRQAAKQNVGEVLSGGIASRREIAHGNGSGENNERN